MCVSVTLSFVSNAGDLSERVMFRIAQVVTTRDEGLLAEVCHEAGMLGGPGHPAVAATLALITSHTPHLLITQYTDWVPTE